ncbi:MULTISPECIES: porin [Paraburkholderia]|jgi:predicted porin|uniref:porin n=1 Tax=Paraburkholderia TaxID=1822464 RepID=UPI0038BB6805
MKRGFAVAIAVATVGTTAHAQSSVTMYGAVDTGLLYQNTSAASYNPAAPNTGHFFKMANGGIYTSMLGFKGTEDLGGGWKTNFKLQGAFDATNGKFGLSGTAGAAAQFNQEASVGLAGPYGSLTMGRQIIPLTYAMAYTDVRQGGYFGSIFTALVSMNSAAGWPGTSTNAQLGAVFDDNAIVYASPNFGGVTASLEYAPGGVAGQAQGSTRESAVLQYDNYGLKLAAAYYNGHDTNPTPTTVPTGLDNNRFYYLGALYSINGFSVSTSFSNGRNPAHPKTTNFDMISGGLGYRFTPAFEVTSGVYYIKDENNSANKSTEIVLGANYSLSKETTLYAQVGYVDNQGKMNQSIEYGQPVAPGLNTTAAMVGIRKRF